jgi:hypothetical protein
MLRSAWLRYEKLSRITRLAGFFALLRYAELG